MRHIILFICCVSAAIVMALGCSDSGGPSGDGATCVEDADCAEGLVCNDGLCSIAPPPDLDNDTIPDDVDNCLYVANPDQSDADMDGLGNVCDIPNDDDKDGVPNLKDNCIAVPNFDQADDDADDIGNACDDCPSEQCTWEMTDEPGLQLLFDPRKQVQKNDFGNDKRSIFDYSGRGHDGKMSTGMAGTAQTNPSALFFDGVDDLVDFKKMLDEAIIAESDSIMSLWIKTGKRDRYSFPITTHYSNGFGVTIEKYSGRPLFPPMWSPNNHAKADTSIDVADDKWHLLTVVNRRTASNLMFVDSKLIYEEPLAEKTAKKTYWTTSPLYLGYSEGAGAASYFSGHIGAGYVLIYNGRDGVSSSLPNNFDAIIKKEHKKTKGDYPNAATATGTPKSYYFSSLKGKDENNCLSVGTPCKTLLKLHSLWNSVDPGDSVLLEKGSVYMPAEYKDNVANDVLVQLHALIHPPFDKGGTADKRITIGAYGAGNRPVISTEKLSPTLRVSALAITGGSYFDIRDLEFRGHLNLYAYTDKGVHDIRFTSLFIDNRLSGGSFKAFGRVINDCVTAETCEKAPLHHIEIGNSTINGIHQIYKEPEKWIWLDAVAIVITASQGDIWIHNNDFILPDADGYIDITGGDNITIEYNKCIGLEGQNGILGYKIQPGSHSVDNLLIRGNLILVKGEAKQQPALIVLQATNSNIYNNTLIGWPATTIKRAGYSFVFGDICTYKTYNTFANNNITNNIFVGITVVESADGCVLKLRDGSSPVITSNPLEINKFSNNIYHNFPGHGSDIVFNKASFTGVGYNWDAINGVDIYTGEGYDQTNKWVKSGEFQTEWLSNKNVTGDKMADPLFIDSNYQSAAKYGNFRLHLNSPAKAAGVPIDGYTKNLDGKDIPPGLPPNIGCY